MRLNEHPRRNMEESGVEGDLTCVSLDQDASEAKNVSIWLRECSCDILTKNLAAFHPCLKTLPEDKLKCIGLIVLPMELQYNLVKTENEQIEEKRGHQKMEWN